MVEIKAELSDKELEEYIQRVVSDSLEDIYEVVEHRFKEAVVEAQNVDTYKDRTTALRNSIGCIVAVNGKETYSSYAESSAVVGTSEGEACAKGELIEDESEGLTAVLVAGMPYAEYVERKGFDVLTGSTLQIEEDIEQRIQRILEDNAKG